MRTLLNSVLTCFLIFTLFLACKKTQEVSDLDKLRNSSNRKAYPVASKDSAQAIASITTQKTQELLDLATLYRAGNGDTEIDSVIYAQMGGYFDKFDSTKIKPVLREIDSLKAKSAKVSNLTVNKKVDGKDTIDYANFDVEYFSADRKSVATLTKNARFVLTPNPVKFKKEFKFYFTDFNYALPKDSTSRGVTK